MIGLNKNSFDAEIHGFSPNPYASSETGKAIIFVVVFLLILVIIAVLCYVRAKKIEKARTVTFENPAATASFGGDEGEKRRYKNGVEIKPSEYAKEKKKESSPAKVSTNINDTVDDDEEEKLDSAEQSK